MKLHADIAFVRIHRFSVNAQIAGNFLVARTIHPQGQYSLFLTRQ